MTEMSSSSRISISRFCALASAQALNWDTERYMYFAGLVKLRVGAT